MLRSRCTSSACEVSAIASMADLSGKPHEIPGDSTLAFHARNTLARAVSPMMDANHHPEREDFMTTLQSARTFLVVVMLAAATPSAPLAQRSPDALLQEAVQQELVAGDLPKAIALYKDFVSRHAGNRPLAAQALANMGRAYEKLGAAEARGAYERLVRDYADQANSARFARERLVALGPDPSAAKRSTNEGAYALVFPDLPPLRPTQHAQFDFSPGGDQIVLRVAPDESDATMGPSLVVANSNGVVVRTLLPGARRVGRISPRWSPDGKYIAYVERSFVESETQFSTLNIIPAEGGRPRIIQSNVITNNFPASGGLFWTND